MINRRDATSGRYRDLTLLAFFQKHPDDRPRTLATKELTEFLLVKIDAVFLYELDEIRRSVAGKSGFAEVRILRNEVFRRSVDVREVAASATGDDYLAPELRVALDD